MKLLPGPKLATIATLGSALLTPLALAELNSKKSSFQEWESSLRDSAVDDSFRLSLNLGSPRRFATRFLKHNRTFQLRIFPATAKEVSDSQFYDTRFVKRVLVEEQNGEVTLSLQLKNTKMGWLATTQEDPWRIVLDFWSLDAKNAKSLAEEWNWQSGESSQSNSGATVADEAALHSLDSSNSTDKRTLEVPAIPGNSKETLSSTSNAVQAADKRDFGLNDIFVPMERPSPKQPRKISTLQENVGKASEGQNEFEALAALASEHYTQGEFEQALQVFRRASGASDRKFKDSDRILWQAGESAHLTKKQDAAKDYLRALVFLHPQSPFASQAKVRINDLDLLKETESSAQINETDISKELLESYSSLANESTSTQVAKIAASVRITLQKIEQNPSSAKMFQQNFNTCVTFDRTPIATQKSCAYILTRSAIDDQDLLSADKALVGFKFRFPDDTRIAAMERKVQARVEQFLNETVKSTKWENWISFETSARPDLLNFSLTNPDLTLARAQAFAELGDRRKATTLFNVAYSNLPDNSKRNEAASELARLATLDKDNNRIRNSLNRISRSESRKTEGLTSKTISNLRVLALSPFNNPTAFEILLDEMKFGRYSENELGALVQFAKLTRRKTSAETIAQKLLQYPAKSQPEIAAVELALLQYATDLNDQNRLQRSAEIYMAVANMTQGTKRAEAAYKAGVSFARAGLFEKAKESWQSAASDLNDKRYSTLANERLERLR